MTTQICSVCGRRYSPLAVICARFSTGDIKGRSLEKAKMWRDGYSNVLEVQIKLSGWKAFAVTFIEKQKNNQRQLTFVGKVERSVRLLRLRLSDVVYGKLKLIKL